MTDFEILTDPEQRRSLDEHLNLIEYSAISWSTSKTTSFNLASNNILGLRQFSKKKQAPQSDLISRAVYEFLKMNPDNSPFTPCPSKSKIKSSVRISKQLLTSVRKYALVKETTASAVVDTAICDFLARYR